MGVVKKLMFYLAREAFSLLSRSAYRETRPDIRSIRMKYLKAFAPGDGLGHYASYALEESYCEIARAHDVPLYEYTRNTCLIVMTRSYFTGGHTRVVERWIETDRRRRYSVAFTAKTIKEIPDRLRTAVHDSGGSLLYVYKGEDVDTGVELRRVSSQFESVVLFTHMDDPTPIIAYGTEKFRRPVGFYNHADHRFWYGVSVADWTAELRGWGKDLSSRYRGIVGQTIVGVPCESSRKVSLRRVDARRQLGIGLSANVVTCVGRVAKMRESNGVNMLSVIDQLLSSDRDMIFLMVGIDETTLPGWLGMVAKYKGRLRCQGEVVHDELQKYYGAADIVLDSLPLGGITALEDALLASRPILSCMSDVDWLSDSSALCKDPKEMVAKTLKLLERTEEGRKAVVSEQLGRLLECAGMDAFQRNIEEFFKCLLKQSHSVKIFREVPTNYIGLDRFYAGRVGMVWYVGKIARMFLCALLPGCLLSVIFHGHCAEMSRERS